MPKAEKKSNTPIAEPPVEEAKVEKIPAPPLAVPRFGLAEESRNVWKATVPSTISKDDLVEEGYWANVSRSLNPGDEIICMPDDMLWRLDLQVIAAGNIWAQVVPLAHYDLSPVRPHEQVPSRYQIQFAGAHHKWRVLRDGDPIKDGFASEKIARQWANNHEMAVSRK